MKRVLLALLALLVSVALLLWLALRASLPIVEGRVEMSGLLAPAAVRFDTWQRPYVEAGDFGDALQVQGWLHASHRLWQMELLRRAGNGRLAELLGRDLLQTDRELWKAGVPQLAARLEDNAAPETLALVDRYLLGVNQGIDGYALLPPEFLLLRAPGVHWTRRDVFALGALMAYQSANNMQNELLRLALADRLDPAWFRVFVDDRSAVADYPFALPPDLAVPDSAKLGAVLERLASSDPLFSHVVPRLGFGSNGWVVAAERSAEGAPLYAFDSHDALGLPNLFYEVHLFFEGSRQLRGWSVPGLPGVINGFNEHIAWGFTNIGDTQDLFVEQRSPDDPLLFREGSDWYRARVETVTIPVAGERSDTLEIVHTRNGPLVSDEPPISLAWSVQRIDHPSLDSLFAFNLARDWEEFNTALDAVPGPSLNATYADVHGTIGLRTAGALPERGRGNGRMPQNGADMSALWRGLVPAAQMPRRENPWQGFLAAANARVNAAGDGPLVSADNAAPYRIARIQAALSANAAFSAEDMRRLQMDWGDGQAQLLLPTLLSQTRASLLNPAARSALELVQAWSENPSADAGSAPALIFQRWYTSLAEEVFAEQAGDLWPTLARRNYVLNQALDQLILDDPASVWWRGDRSAVISMGLNRAVGDLVRSLGEDPAAWRLDDQQHVQLRHELAEAVPLLASLFSAPDAPWGGSPSTVGRAGYLYSRPGAVRHGATVRAVAVLSQPPRVASIFPGGQSGHPLSKHYLDQYPGWLHGELYPIAAFPDQLPAPDLRLVPRDKLPGR